MLATKESYERNSNEDLLFQFMLNLISRYMHGGALYQTNTIFIRIVPKHNVSTCNLSASVIEGVCRTRNSLLDGNTQFYDWESGYTCHQLRSGCILIQLGQPYLIDSMRFAFFNTVLEYFRR